MGIFNKLFSGGSKKEFRQPFMSSFQTRFDGQSMFRNEGNYILEYKNWVYACVSSRAEDVGSIQLKLMRGDEEVKEHKLLDLIDKVNPYMTKDDLFYGTQAFKDLEGNAYWYLAREGEDGLGEIKEIYLLRPDRMRIVINKENPLQVDGYVYIADSRNQIPFKPSEILHFRNFNPKGNHPVMHKGMGVVEAALNSIDSDNEARLWNYNFFKKSARPDGVLIQKGDGVATPEEHKRLEEEWNEKFRGSENSHKVAILGGGLDWKDIQRSQKDMDFVNQRTFSRDEILALFKVPKTIIGITDDVNRANAEASNYVFALRTIKPLMKKLVNTMNEFLVPAFGDDLYFDFVSPVPEDRLQTTNEYTQGINKWLSRNEIRAREGLPPTENGDTFYGSFSDIETDKVVPEQQKSAKLKVKEVKKGKQTVGEKVVDKFMSKLPQKIDIKTIEDDVRKKYIENWQKQVEISTAPLKKKMNKFFDEQEKEVIANLKEEFKGLEVKEFKLKGLSDIVFDEDDAVEAGISLITPFLRTYINQSGRDASQLVDKPFSTDSPRISKFIEQRAKYFADSVNETTADALTDTLKQGIDAGETIDELSKRVAEVYDSAVDFRSERIARTEVSASGNFGAVEAFQQAGVEKIQWQVVNPEDEDCLENDGEIVTIGEAFSSGDERPPVHPNCVCTTIPIF